MPLNRIIQALWERCSAAIVFGAVLLVGRRRLLRGTLAAAYLAMVSVAGAWRRARRVARRNPHAPPMGRGMWCAAVVSSNDEGVYRDLRFTASRHERSPGTMETAGTPADSGHPAAVVLWILRLCEALRPLSEITQRRELRSDLYVMF